MKREKKSLPKVSDDPPVMAGGESIHSTEQPSGTAEFSESTTYPSTISNENRIGLPDENGIIRYFKYEDILLIRSDNNYLSFFFTEKSKITKKVIKGEIG